MFPMLLSITVFVSWIIYIIRTYYSKSYSLIDHIESAIPGGLTPTQVEMYVSPLVSYLVALLAIYVGYKIWTIWIAPRDKISFGIGKIIGFFLVHFILLCISFFSLPEAGEVRGFMGLFFGTLQYLLYPLILILLTRTAGATILSYIFPNWKDEDLRIRLGIETSIGFLLFITLMLIWGIFGLYTLPFLIFTLIILAVISYPSYLDTWNLLTREYFTVENHNFSKGWFRAINPYLLSGEFAFMVLTFIMGISFISIFRPMPIGWDDLGVYMNYPKMMALSHTVLPGASYIAWQLVTGTGFLLGNSATQAFFLNQIGGILSIIALVLAGSYWFTNPKKRYIIALPLLLATLWYALPMIIFQQAKDMKLDPALFFFSVSAVTALLGRWPRFDLRLASKESCIYLGIIGVLVGLAFTTKLTTLMLIIASIGFVSYKVLGIGGITGFTFLFLGVFTKLNLWKMMGVTVTADVALANTIAFACLGISGVAYALVLWSQVRGNSINYLKYVVVFSLGVAIPVIPWTIKHGIELVKYEQPFSLYNIIQGAGGYQLPDFSKLYTKEEIETIKQKGAQNMTTSGQSQNEDMGRYFGYENGLNNYLRLAPNLTFQKNQPGEFTDITYVFLALVPVLFLFLAGRVWYLPVVLIVLLGASMYWFGAPRAGGVQDALTTFFSDIVLPYGYIFILAIMFLGLGVIHYGLVKNEKNAAIQDVSAFLSLYLFIYVIAAFGIVWYGIVMYFCFLLLIGLASSSFAEYDEHDEKNYESFMLKISLSMIVFGTVAYYFVQSSFPHSWNNLRQAYYPEFKAGQLTDEAAIFKYRSDYLDPIAYMNLNNPEELVRSLLASVKNPKLKDFFAKQNIIRPSDLHNVISAIDRLKGNEDIKSELRSIGQGLYSAILYPSASSANNEKIFRIGTFMTYFIINNRTRFLEDSLLFDFNDYIYDENPAVAVERMRKMGARFFLTDLNAATIDKDPRHALTTRFENLLRTMTAQDMELVATDSTCLKVAVEDAKKGILKGDAYIDVAGINYESYRTVEGKAIVVGRGEKRAACFNYILDKIFKENAVSSTSYPYLLELKDIIEREGLMNDKERLSQFLNGYFAQSWFALFRIKDANSADPVPTSVVPATLPSQSPNSSGSTVGSGS